MVGMLHEKIADIAVADLTVTNESSTVVDFLPALMEITEELYMKNPGDAFSFVSYIGSFRKLAWIGVVCWTIAVPLLLFVMMKNAVGQSDEQLKTSQLNTS